MKPTMLEVIENALYQHFTEDLQSQLKQRNEIIDRLDKVAVSLTNDRDDALKRERVVTLANNQKFNELEELYSAIGWSEQHHAKTGEKPLAMLQCLLAARQVPVEPDSYIEIIIAQEKMIMDLRANIDVPRRTPSGLTYQVVNGVVHIGDEEIKGACQN